MKTSEQHKRLRNSYLAWAKACADPTMRKLYLKKAREQEDRRFIVEKCEIAIDITEKTDIIFMRPLGCEIKEAK